MINLECEIRQQPDVLRGIYDKNISTVRDIVSQVKARGIDSIYFAARGTSDHACVYAQYLFAIIGGIPCMLGTPSVITEYGASLNYGRMLVVGVSQSGRAADVLAVLEDAKKGGAVTVAVTNNDESPLALAAQHHLFCACGDETSIAATKTFTAEMYLLAMLCAEWTGKTELTSRLYMIPEKLDELLSSCFATIEEAAEKYKDISGAIVLGRGMAYPIALEGALKILETNKLSMKGYPLADFYHGPVAQVKSDDLVIVISFKGAAENDSRDMMKKLDGIGARILLITDDPTRSNSEASQLDILLLPSTGSEFTAPFTAAVAMQLLACKMAEVRGIDPDVSGVIKKITITR